MKSKVIKYTVTTLIGLLMAYIVLNNYGFFDTDEVKHRFLCLSNAFTIPGVVFVMCGALVWISQQGMFDSLTYAGRVVIDQFRWRDEHLRYAEYVLEKREKRKHGGYGFLIITGSVFVAISLIFYVLFYMN